jgi:hypothetical protein
VLDGETGRLGGTVTRRPSCEVIAELEAEDAAEAAQAAARNALHEQKKPERKEKLEESKGRAQREAHSRSRVLATRTEYSVTIYEHAQRLVCSATSR